ncbi:MAG: TolC family protein [Limnochordia bacterium]|nr:TolC family protein [Limnochordia bacterium]
MRRILLLLVSLALLVTSWSVSAAEPVALSEAVQLALQQNKELQLFYRQWELSQRKIDAERILPVVQFQSTPIAVSSSGLGIPKGQLSLRLPLGEHGSVQGQVAFQVEEGIQYHPSAELSVNYPLFRAVKKPDAATDDASLTKAQNEVIQQVYRVFVEYERADRELVFRRKMLEYYQDEKTGMLLTDAESSKLFSILQEIEKTTTTIATLELQKQKAQEDLMQLLDLGDIYPASLDPGFAPVSLEQQQMMERAIQHSSTRSAAQEALDAAMSKLQELQRTKGWDFNLSLGCSWEPQSTDYGLYLTATSALYPTRGLEIEEAELAVENAQLSLQRATFSVEQETVSMFRQLSLLEDTVQRLEERLANTQTELHKLQRQFEAGMITELTLRGVQLNLEELALQIRSTQHDHLLLQLELLHKCGFSLEEQVKGR